MSTGIRFGLWLLAFAFSAVSLPAQQSAPVTPHPGKNIYLDVVVTAKNGPPVTGLQQPEFTLLDNKAPQPITSFHAFAGKEVPLEVVIVVDAVNISYSNLVFARGQVESFLRANGGHLAHPTALAVVTDKGTQMQEGFSTDGNALSASLDEYGLGLRIIRRSAGFYGATERFQLSITALRQLAAREAARPGRKFVLWVSPGWPILSGPNVVFSGRQQQQLFGEIVDVSTQLRKARIALYSVDPLGSSEPVGRTFHYQEFTKGVSRSGQVQVGDLALQVLAVQSGGLALSSSNDVTALLQKAMADAQAYYEIGFEPARPERPDEYHHLEVRLANGNLIARARQGYYAQP